MEHDPLSTSWYDSSWIPFLNVNNIIDYFTGITNSFYDRTCNNEIIKMQHLKPEQMNLMTGIEYVLFYAQEPILFVVRKQYRHGPDHRVSPLADYHVIAGVVYQTPSIGAIINARMLAATNHLQVCFDEAWSMARYDPSKGYSWSFSDEKSKKTKIEVREEISLVGRRQRVDGLIFDLAKKFPPSCQNVENDTKKRNRDENVETEVKIEQDRLEPPVKRIKYT